MNFVDAIRDPQLWALKAGFAGDVLYQAAGVPAPSVIKAFAVGKGSADAFASFQQRDIVAVVDAAQFVIVIGKPTPQRFDRMIIEGQRYSVEDSRGAPMIKPVFFKILLRGSVQ